MSVLYCPVLIESAEQAEALPEGARVLEDRDGLPRAWAKSGDVFLGHGLVLLIPREVVGMQALVPIEAEEETARPMKHPASCLSFGPDDELPEWLFDGPPRTRLVTPWEEA